MEALHALFYLPVVRKLLTAPVAIVLIHHTIAVVVLPVPTGRVSEGADAAAGEADRALLLEVAWG